MAASLSSREEAWRLWEEYRTPPTYQVFLSVPRAQERRRRYQRRDRDRPTSFLLLRRRGRRSLVGWWQAHQSVLSKLDGLLE